MKYLIFSILIFSLNYTCSGQVIYNEFRELFTPLTLPIENITNLPDKDTINAKLTNQILIRSQNEKPKYVDKNNNKKIITQYYGLYPEEPFKYGYRGKQLYFYNKIIPIGCIKINEEYETLIVKVVSYETTFYDLWSFSKEGKALSVVCLFWGMRDGGPNDENVTFTIVDSNITKDGDIIWHENSDGLETFRTYKLNNDGLFQIMKEEQKGEAEF